MPSKLPKKIGRYDRYDMSGGEPKVIKAEDAFRPEPPSRPSTPHLGRGPMMDSFLPSFSEISNFFGRSKKDNEVDVQDIDVDDEGPAKPDIRGKDINLPLSGRPKTTRTSQVSKPKLLRSRNLSGIATLPSFGNRTEDAGDDAGLDDTLSSFDSVENKVGDISDNFDDNYARENSPYNLYQKHLQGMPTRGSIKNTKLDKLRAALTTFATGDVGEGRKELDSRYGRALEDWSIREQALRHGAEQEYKFNNPMNSLRAADIQSRINGRAFSQGQQAQRTAASTRLMYSKAASIDAMVNTQGWKTSISDDGEVILFRVNPQGQTEIRHTGVDSLEYDKFQEAQRNNAFNRGATTRRLGQGDSRIKQGQDALDLNRRRTNALYPEEK